MLPFQRVLPLIFMTILTACDSPSVAFMGSTKTIILIEESRFSVHRRDDQVEVYRTSFEMLPPLARVLQRAELAIQQATGCEVKSGSLVGDQAIIKATLACHGQPEIQTIPEHLRYECEIVDGWDTRNDQAFADALECDLVPI